MVLTALTQLSIISAAAIGHKMDCFIDSWLAKVIWVVPVESFQIYNMNKLFAQGVMAFALYICFNI